MQSLKSVIIRSFLGFLIGLAIIDPITPKIPTYAQTIISENNDDSSPPESTQLEEPEPGDPAVSLYWQGRYSEAISLWEKQLLSASPSQAALKHGYLGLAYRSIGQLGRAIEHFRQSNQFYRRHSDDNSSERLASGLIEQAKTHIELGQADRAITLINEALFIIESNNITGLSPVAYQTLGSAYLLKGDWSEAIGHYQRGRDLASVLEQPDSLVGSLNNLYTALLRRQAQSESEAKLAQSEGDDTEAARLRFLAQQDRHAAVFAASLAAKISLGWTNFSRVRAILNLYKVSPELSKTNYLEQAQLILDPLPASRQKANLLIEIASLHQEESLKRELLQQAETVASALGDNRTASFALGELGHLEQQLGNLPDALDYTSRAQLAAQSVMAIDSLYKWQWQASRIYTSLGEIESAKKAYRGAISSLETLRFEIARTSPEFQLDVQAQVEPVYREFLSLLLKGYPNSQQLGEALTVRQQLQLTELQSFFGDACLEIRKSLVTSNKILAAKTARVYTFVLPDAAYIILELPSSPLRFYQIKITELELSSLIERWRSELESFAIPFQYEDLSRHFYKVFIKPMEADLTRAGVDTLIFVNDGLLRNIPMAALYDGQQFLIEKYAIVNSLGFNLNFSYTPKSYQSSIFGLSVPVNNFPALPQVPLELQQIKQTLGGNTFLDSAFTEVALEKEIKKNYPVIHLATHGEFGGTSKTTFIQTYSEEIHLPEFERILSQRLEPIELLTLSACQTAAGNRRAILGLAGVALRSGTQNVVASLWAVEDFKTKSLIPNFYQYWRQGNSKAKALQKAQKELIKADAHPKFWSAFVLYEN